MRKFGLRDKLAYMAGDMANDFTFMMVSSFLLVFYTKVLGISGYVTGILFLVGRLVDAFTDVTMGRIVDTHKVTSEGRFRYFIIRAAPFVCISGVALFAYWVKDFSYTAKVVYIFVTYLIWGSVCYTAVNIPYGSMASVISPEPEHRTQLSAWRTLGASIANIIIAVGGPTVLYVYENGQPVVIPERFTYLAAALALCAFFLYVWCYKESVERIQVETDPNAKKADFKALFASLKQNSPLLRFIFVAIALLITIHMTSGLNAFLYQDFFKDINALKIGGAFGAVGAFFVIPFVGVITGRWGKQASAAVGLAFTSICYFVLWFYRVEDATTYLIAIFIGNMGYIFMNVIVWAFITDIIDDQEVRTHKREDGTIYAVYSFSRKLGQAAAGGLVGFALSQIGYDSLAKSQTQEVANNIYDLYNASAAIGFAACAFLLFFVFPLNLKRVRANTAELKARKGQA